VIRDHPEVHRAYFGHADLAARKRQAS
jgi:hypothetical protein